MSNFSLNIVEWLLENNIVPLTSDSKSTGTHIQGINYSNHRTEKYVQVHSTEKKWWRIYFKKFVVINSYQIFSRQSCNWLRNWNVSVSINGMKWDTIDSKRGEFASNSSYILDKEYVARYFKLEGNSEGCSDERYLAFHHIKFFGSIATDNYSRS